MNRIVNPGEESLNRRRIIFILIGLVAGFTLSFLWTRETNRTGLEAKDKTGGVLSGARGDAASQASMAQVQEKIKRARDNPSDFNAQFVAAYSYYQIGRLTETVEFLKKAYDINPKEACINEAPRVIAQWNFEQQVYDEAEKWFLRQLECSPQDTDSMTELAAIYLKKQPPDPDRAIAHLNAVLKLRAQDTHALFHLVEANILKKDSAGATAALKRLQEVSPDDQRIPDLQSHINSLKPAG